MIPRVRAWDKDFKTMYEADDIVYINFEEKQICVKTLFFERASRYDFNDIVLMQSTGLADKNGRHSLKTRYNHYIIKRGVPWQVSIYLRR